MANLLKKFKCSSCQTVGSIELVHDDAYVVSAVLNDDQFEDQDLIYDEPIICNYISAWYRCAQCDQKIDCDSDTESLIEFLEGL